MTKDQITHVSDEELGAAIAEPQFAGAYALMKAEMERRSLQKMLAASESLRQATATMAADVERIANSSGKLEVLSSALIAETANVHRQVVVLTASSHNIEWLTKWLIWLTVALGLFTLALVADVGNKFRLEYFSELPPPPAPQTPPLPVPQSRQEKPAGAEIPVPSATSPQSPKNVHP